MRRLSIILGDLTDNLDAISGKYMLRRMNSEIEGKLKDVPKEIIWCNAEVFLSGCTQVLEYLVVKPASYIENIVMGEASNKNYPHNI